MGFMEPEILHTTWYEVDGNMGTEWIQADLIGDIPTDHHDFKDASGPSYAGYEFPDGAFPIPDALKDYCENSKYWSLDKREGYGARLTAPGYIDCTDWAVFQTEKEAQEYLAETYEICGDCGREAQNENGDYDFEGTFCPDCQPETVST